MTLPMDIRMAATTARIGFVFGRLGIVPEATSTFFLPRIVGLQKSLELVYAADILTAFKTLVRTVLPAPNGDDRDGENAGELVDGRLNAPGNAADADAHAQRERPERGPQIQNQRGERRQLRRNGLKFITGGNGIGQPDELLTQMLFRRGREVFPQQGTHVPAGGRGNDIGDQYGVDSVGHKVIRVEPIACTNLYTTLYLYVFVQILQFAQ